MSVRGFVRRNGIGMKICKPFTEHFREREWVRFQDGCGFAFKFALPARRHDEKGGARR
jgi:light-regulated signal transduction histidine kinase (bacteriophytochrome)